MKNREMYLEAMSEGGQTFDKIRQNMINGKIVSKFEIKKLMFILSIVEEYNEEIETQDFSKKIIGVGAIEP